MRGQPTPPTMEKKKPNTISAAIDDDLFNFIEDIRWNRRLSKTEIVTEALKEWAIKRGYSEDGGT